jgi:hypothetical protein
VASVANLKSVQTTAEDDGIREAHGLYLGSKPIALLSEQGNRVVLVGDFHDRLLTPRQARYLARKLNHLARRIEKRELGA